MIPEEYTYRNQHRATVTPPHTRIATSPLSHITHLVAEDIELGAVVLGDEVCGIIRRPRRLVVAEVPGRGVWRCVCI